MTQSYHTLRFACASAFLGLLLAGFTSCGKRDPNSPGVEFMPDMYRSPSLEAYGTTIIDGDSVHATSTRFLPVTESISRGYVPYAYPNTKEGYEAAGINVHNPLSAADRENYEKEGEVIYGKFCIHCHGATGAGDGKVAAKLPGAPPAYNGALKNLPEGKIYHSITYGKGLMGSHAGQLSQTERWKLVYFVQKLQGPKDLPVADSSKAANTVPARVIASK